MTQDHPPSPEHSDRVRQAFDSFTAGVRDRLDEEARHSVENLRQAASAKDSETMRRHLDALRDRHSWLYRELAAHPAVANLLDELALMGL